MNKKYWSGKTVLVTGVTGFVGSSLAQGLDKAGAKIVAIIRDEVAESNFYRSGLDKKAACIRGKLEEYSVVERVINEYSPEVIYHLGAQTIVGIANRSPLSTFHSNIQGTWNLLEACRGKNTVRAIVVASSDKAYGTHKKLPYREDFALQPEHPYDVSKACADLIARSYFKTYGLPIVITRFANIYGPGDMNFSRIVPDAIRSVLQNKAPIIRSDGTPERDYLYVDDVVDLYLLLAESIEKIKGEVFNAGHNRPISVLDVVKTIIRLSGKKLKPDIQGRGSLHGEIDRQWLDGSKVKKILGWTPRTKLIDGLQKTISWYSKNIPPT